MDQQNATNISNFTVDLDEKADPNVEIIVEEIIFTVAVVSGIIADAAIIFTIFRFKNMRTVPNIFLANWAIADLCSLVVMPTSYRAISTTDDMDISGVMICVLFETDFIFHQAAIAFMIIILLDWCIAAFFTKTSEKFRNFCKYIIAGLWIFVLLSSSGSIRLCIRGNPLYLSIYLFLFNYCSLLLFVFVLQCARAVCKCKKTPVKYPTLMLTLATVCVTCWFVGVLNFYFIVLEQIHPVVRIFVKCFVFSSSTINFALLYYLDKDFQERFLKIVKRADRGLSNSIPPSDNKDRSLCDKCTVQVSLESLSREIPTNSR